MSTMNQLEDDFGLAGFRIHEDRIEALVRNVGEVSVEPGGVRVTALSPSYDRHRFDAVVRLALRPFEPADCHLVMRYQVLEGISLDYDTARTRAINAWLQPVGQAKLTDVAILLDGEDTDSGLSFQIEYGIVSRLEAPNRLRRWAGRTHHAERGSSGLDVDDSNIPDVAFFADFYWHHRASKDEASSDSLLETEHAAMQRSLQIATDLHHAASVAPTTLR